MYLNQLLRVTILGGNTTLECRCEWGHTRVHYDFESSGTGQRVWAFVGTPDPKRHHGSLTQAAGVHGINYVLLGWHHGESLVVANAVGVLTSTSRVRC